MKLSTLILLTCVLQTSTGWTQTPEPINIATLNKNNISTANYPFDIPFYIKAKVPDNCTRIIFRYKVSAKEKKKDSTFRKWISLPVSNPSDAFFLSDDKPYRPGDGDFLMFCKGLHPNMRYDFAFEVYKEPLTDDKLKTELKQKISARLLKFTDDHKNTGFVDSNITALNNDLTAIISAGLITDAATQKLKLKKDPDNEFEVNIRNDLKEGFDKLVTEGSNLESATTALKEDNAAIKRLIDTFTTISRPGAPQPLATELTALLANQLPLTDNSKALLDLNITPSLESFKGYTLRNGLLVLKKLSQSPSLLNEILKGNKKISNNDVITVSPAALDAESVYFLAGLIRFLKEGNLTTTQAVPNNVLFRQVDNLSKFLDATADQVGKLVKARGNIAIFTSKLPDLTTSILIQESITQETITIPDVTTQNTPYISVEGGIGYGTAFEAVFNYYGANFYFSPVNKKARLSIFKGWNLVKKMICFNLGIANQFGDRPVNSYSILGSGSNDLYVGLGVRLGRIIKLNLSSIPYKVSTNPLTTDKKLRIQFFAGVGADVNLLGALGTLGKTLRIVQ